jgi:hypothetical protein
MEGEPHKDPSYSVSGLRVMMMGVEGLTQIPKVVGLTTLENQV